MDASTEVLGNEIGDALDGLDRESLLGIARSMQLKVSTRMRKAELVELIRAEPKRELFDSNGSNGRSAGGVKPGAASQAAPAAKQRSRGEGNGSSAPDVSVEQVAKDLSKLLPPITVAPKEPEAAGSAAVEAVEPSLRQEVPAESGSRRSRRRRGKDRGERQEGFEPPAAAELAEVSGTLDLRDDGYGFLRTNGYLSSGKDVYVPTSLARRLNLRKGDVIVGAAKPASSNEKYPALVRVDSISGLDVETARRRPRFEDLTPLFPNERFVLESQGDPEGLATRVIDLIAPIGKGQRGMIVSPPKAGKTTVVKQIAHAIERNNPGVVLLVLLIDERPEEVTDIRRSVRGEVISSTFDRPADEHTQVAELTIEVAKRMVEFGKDVVIILDGITRLARAYNLAQPATGRIMSGGVDSGALYPPKKFFGAARNVEEGGSLTILATALVETGSKMDEVIFEEFKGTGNMELRLDRRLSERRLFPAIDVNASSTRHEELLFSRDELNQVWKLRRVLNAITQEGSAGAGLELLIDKIKSTRSNAEFLSEIARSSGF